MHVRDSDFYDDIYSGASKKRDKYERWTAQGGCPRSTFATVHHDLHRQRRAALNPFFAKRSIVRLESRISEKVKILCTRLAEEMAKGTVIDTMILFMAYTMDVTTEYCYGRSDNFLNEPDFKRSWRECMAGVFENAAVRRHMPWITYAAQRLPTSVVLTLMPGIEPFINWQKHSYQEVKAILDRGPDSKDAELESIFQSLRDNPDLPKEEKSLQRLAEEGEVLIGAGSETTSRALAYTLFYVVNAPDILRRLREELRTVMKNNTDLPAWTDLEKLPYLVSIEIRLSNV